MTEYDWNTEVKPQPENKWGLIALVIAFIIACLFTWGIFNCID
jgi:hypothetical protein